MTETTYYPKQEIRTAASFVNSSGVAVNPSTITPTITKVHASVETVIDTLAIGDLENPSTGSYYYDYTPGSEGPGNYFFNWVSTNPNTEDEKKAIVVDSHRV